MQSMAMFGMLLAGLFPMVAIAQTPASDAKPSEIQQPPSPDPAASDMRPVAVGDHWTYLSRDNLTGDLIGEFTQTVTDVGNTDVSVSVKWLGQGIPSYSVFDQLWNVKSTNIAKFEPNDGTGVNSTMKISDSWNSKASDIRSSQTLWKRAETSKVIGQESVTTSAGTFNAIKYETVINIRGAIDPSQKATVTTTTWWVPEINHWVKRSEKTFKDKQVKSNWTVELTDFGRS